MKPPCPEPASVVVVDDHRSLREMLRVVLERDGAYRVVGEASGGVEALRVCRAQRPALVILDLMLPELCGTLLIGHLAAEPLGARVLVYTGSLDENLLRAAPAARPHGFVKKEDTLGELRAALRAVLRGSDTCRPRRRTWRWRGVSSSAGRSLRRSWRCFR